jgi:hypothetical protein
MSRPFARLSKFLWVIGVLASVIGMAMLLGARHGPQTWGDLSKDLKTRLLTSIEEATPRPDMQP